MNNSLFRIFISLLLFSGIGTQSFADILPRPAKHTLVVDNGEVLTKQEEEALEYKLRYFHDTTSNQILVLTVKSLDGHTAFDYAHTIGETWQIGQKDFDNGIVVLVKPEYGPRDKGQAFIATGYGMEAAIPDAIVKRILENEMFPHFRNGDYYTGLDQATDVLMALASGEISADGYNQSNVPKGVFGIIPIIVIILIFIIIRISSRSYGVGHSGGSSIWTALWLGSMMGNSNSGSWKDFSGGSGGFGGGGSGFGGGFSGFGGGSFGGGGAGGSW